MWCTVDVWKQRWTHGRTTLMSANWWLLRVHQPICHLILFHRLWLSPNIKSIQVRWSRSLCFIPAPRKIKTMIYILPSGDFIMLPSRRWACCHLFLDLLKELLRFPSRSGSPVENKSNHQQIEIFSPKKGSNHQYWQWHIHPIKRSKNKKRKCITLYRYFRVF